MEEIEEISGVWSTSWSRYHQPPVRYPTGRTPPDINIKVRLPGAVAVSCLQQGLHCFYFI